ncbi:ribosome assembly protein 1 [Fistulifera solaris]|uniref:Ribosome assembly protein 1 n=1 Tax=Fistulifera solaris TaxID=1519565 RepID=A0A1Z5JJM8_FISSO|nr:ribosome assembly protein 1 [Fistulifera solaris]|eukprot:GAX14215.1 ribosome assembly protein 1 [Fistulifera solaris]
MSSIFLEPSATRLVTIIAHVDHGKTTLADNLIEYNGIISERIAGTVRYLDSDPEEQRRGITMRSSAIGLKHTLKSPKTDATENYIIHLLDSPGHTDFSMEVSSSLLACDSCLLVLDAVEGMAPRTHQVLREAYMHRLVPVLVINKIDRLFTDLGLDPTESYLRLRTLLETVNAAASAMLRSAASLGEQEEDETYEACWNFDPAVGNVIFCSALFGWGFTVQSMARSLFRQKVLPIKPVILKQTLFSGVKYVNSKVLKWKQGSHDEPMFAKYVLKPLWMIYQATSTAAAMHENRNQKLNLTEELAQSLLEALETGCTSMDAKLPSTLDELKQLQSAVAASNEELFLRALLRRYRPLAPAILDTICEYCPSPEHAVSAVRGNVLSLCEHFTDTSVVQETWNGIQNCVKACDATPQAPAVAHVSKYISTNRSQIRDPHLPDNGEPTVLLGLARVLSGFLRTGDAYHLFGPKYPASSTDEPLQRTVRLFLLMGSSFICVPEVPAGHLCAVSNLEGVPFKTVTLCNDKGAMPIKGFTGNNLRPLVKVSIEPENAGDGDALERGLVKLSLADAAIEVTSTARGEKLLAALGELHLEQSLIDLERVYCNKEGIKFRVSDPIVDFGESTSWFDKETEENGFEAFFEDETRPPLRQMTIPPYNEEEGVALARHGRSRIFLTGKGAAISVRAVPFAPSIVKALKLHEQDRSFSPDDDTIRDILILGRGLGLESQTASTHSDETAKQILSEVSNLLYFLDSNGNGLMETNGMKTGSSIKGVLAQSGEVFSLNDTSGNPVEEDIQQLSVTESEQKDAYDSLRKSIRSTQQRVEPDETPKSDVDEAAFRIWNRDMRKSSVAGFQMAVRSGWICEEPNRHVLVVLEGVEIALTLKDDIYGPAKSFSGGMVVSAVRTAIRSALISRPARLVEGVLQLTLHSSLTGLGSLYSVLSKRRGKVTEDTMVDGTDLLLISALIPQAESFGLATELFRKTSGEVTAPELIFSHWELLDEDPFWIPTSQEEREDFGELERTGDSSTGMGNIALKYIRQVRQRKGLMVDSSRTVIAAEKQRTLKR